MKKSYIITITSIIILVLIGGGVWYFLKPQPNNQLITNNNQNNEQPATTTEEIDQNQKYQGELVKEDNGWKKYTNNYFGIEFRFRDEEDEIRIFSDRDRLVLGNKDDIQGEPKIYLFFSEYTAQDSNPEYEFIDYLKNSWNSYQEPAQLIAITPRVNKQGTSYYSVTAKVSGGRQSPGITYTSTIYYYDYPQNLREKEKHINYVRIAGRDDSLTESVISSFKFFTD